MPVTYIRHAIPAPQVFDAAPDFSDFHIVVFDAVIDSMPSLPVGDRFRRIDRELFDADLVLFRAPLDTNPDFISELEGGLRKDRIIRTLLRDIPIGLLSPTFSERNGLETPSLRLLRSYSTAGIPQSSDLLPVLRRVELEALLSFSGAILRPSNAHFALPSGLHCDGFVAFDRLVGDSIAVQRISDWLLSEVRPDTGLLGDQRAMLPILLALQVTAALAYGVKIPVHVLQEYPVEPTGVGDAIYDLLDRLGPDGRVVLMLSLYSSGRTARFFREIAPPDSGIIALCHTKDEIPPDWIESFLELEVRRLSVGGDGKCELCRDRELFTIDHQDFARLPARNPNWVTARRELLEKNKEFWLIADECDCVRLHFDDPNGRHQGVYLDTVRLLSHPAFRENIISALKNLDRPRPDVIIVPGHRASELLREIGKEATGCDRVIVLPNGKSEIPDAHKQLVVDAEQVMILDDVLITGSTLTMLRRAVYGLERKAHKHVALEVFVAIARPSRHSDIKYLRQQFVRGDNKAHLHYYAEVLLPDYRGDSCVLCDERRFLGMYAQRLKGRNQACALRRLRLLRSTLESPLSNGDRPDYCEGAFIGRVRRKTAFAATLSVAQMIIEEIHNGADIFKEQKVDAREILRKFFDPEILGGFLRSFGRNLLFYAGHVEEITRELEAFGLETGRGLDVELVQEIAWAAAHGKLPQHAVLRLIERCEANAMLKMLHELIIINIAEEEHA